MSTLEETLLKGSLYPETTSIVSVPIYEPIMRMPLHSNLGDGTLDLLALTVASAVYHTRSVSQFVNPKNPCQNLIIPVCAKDSQSTHLKDTNKKI